MEPKDNFENIALPYVKNVNPTLVWDDILRKTYDDFYRYKLGGNKKIHGIDEKEK